MIRHFETENVISVYNTLFDGAVDLAGSTFTQSLYQIAGDAL
jgi:hypothetical protein